MYSELSSAANLMERVISSSLDSFEHTMNTAPSAMPIITASLTTVSAIPDKEQPSDCAESFGEKNIFHNPGLLGYLFNDTKVNKTLHLGK